MDLDRGMPAVRSPGLSGGRPEVPEPSASGKFFDVYSTNYEAVLAQAVGRFGEELEYFVTYKVDRIRRLCASSPPGHIVDVGCGVGLMTERLARVFPATNVTGVDVSDGSLRRAAARCADLANVRFVHFDGADWRARIRPADLVILANVLHHVPSHARPRFMEQVVLPSLQPGGRVVVFEHNPYNPVTRLFVRFCAMDKDAELLAMSTTRRLLSQCRLRVTAGVYMVFFPRALRWLRGLESALGWLPLGAQHMTVAERQGAVG